MDCISGPEHEWERLDGRPVSVAFHLAEISQALQFMRSVIPASADTPEIDAAYQEALEAVVQLRARLAA